MSLPPLLGALLAGFCLAPYLDISGLSCLPAVVAAMFLVAALAPRKWRPLPACVAMLLLAVVLVDVALQPPRNENSLHRFAGKEEVAITGEVLSVGRSSSGNLYYDLEVEKLVNRRIEVPARGRLRLYLDASQAPFRSGDRLCFRSRLRQPRLFGTPGEFDSVRYLARRDIFTLASVKRTEDIALLAERRPASLLERWRSSNAALIGLSLPLHPDLAGLVRALAQGERIGVDPGHRELLAGTGLSHLFAISGLHFGLVAGFLYGLGVLVWRCFPALLERVPPRRLLPLLLVPLLFVYLEFTGGAVSTWRAFLVLTAAALVMASLRRINPLRALAAAALILLLVDPLLAYEASFQLSFITSAGILLVGMWLHPRLALRPVWFRYPLLLAAVTLSASLASAPLVIFHFKQFAPAGLLLNLLAVPLVSFLALPLALAGTVAGLLWSDLAQLCFWLCGQLLDAVLSLAVTVRAWPAFTEITWFPTPTEWLVLALLVAGLFLVLEKRPRKPVLVMLVAGVLVAMVPWARPPAVVVTALSVGQGESLLLSFDGDRHVLVDAGGFPRSRFDVGERLVVPALAKLGVKQLDAVILSHGHPDHLLGLTAVLEHLPVASLWTAVDPERLPEAARDRIETGQLALHRPTAGWQTLQREGLPLQVYLPEQSGKENDRSLVVYVETGDSGALLTGDLEASGVEQLLRDPPGGTVSLLKLPHHGSRNSAQEKLFNAFSPDIAVVSAGEANRYRHPHRSTVNLYRDAGVPLWRTDIHGSVRMVVEQGKWRVTQWKKGLFR